MSSATTGSELPTNTGGSRFVELVMSEPQSEDVRGFAPGA